MLIKLPSTKSYLLSLLIGILLIITPTQHWLNTLNAENSYINQYATVISTGGKQTCAITELGRAICWGQGGQLGDGSIDTKSVPTQVTGLGNNTHTISSGLNHTCAALNNGTVRCWGRNEYAQLGDGSTNNSTAPVPLPVQVFGVSRVIQLASGSTHTCALTSNGGVKCWGQNNFYAAGGRFNPQQVPIDIVGLNNGVLRITSGDQFSCALMNNGGVKCWGMIEGVTNWGGLKAAPIDIPLTKKARAIAAGFKHVCVILDTEQVACWGNNEYGETGLEVGTGENNFSFVPGLHGAIEIAAGKYETCVIIRGGEVRCWGLNANGQLGNGDFNDSASPVTVKGLPGPAIAIDVSKHTEYDTSGPRWYGGHTCALINNGTVWCWGNNTYGQLGDGTITQARIRPIAVKGLDTAQEVIRPPTPSFTNYRLMLPLTLNQVIIEGEQIPSPIVSVTPNSPPQGQIPDCCEPNDDFNTNAVIPDTVVIQASVHYDTDPVDFYKVTLSSGKTYNIRLNHPHKADLDLYIYDDEGGGRVIERSNQSNNENEQIRFTPPTTRQYFIVVSIATSEVGSIYDLSITQ